MAKKDSFPCYCGSGKAFKSCCKSKVNNYNDFVDRTKITNPKYVNNLLKGIMDRTDFKTCFHPDKKQCKKPIKNAHTLQNNGVLSLLAENNNVIVTDILNKEIKGTILKPVRKNNATTFYGFCEYHDSTLFSDIENIHYSMDKKQNFLYAYRCCSQEYHKKLRVIKSLQNTFKKNPGIYNTLGFTENFELQMLSYKDVESYMQIFNDALLSKNYDILSSYVYQFDKQYNFAVTAMFNLTVDFKGNVINDIYSTAEERQKSLFATFIPAESKSYFILSWLEEDSSDFKEYIDTIKGFDEENLIIFLNNLFPTYSENIVLSPRLVNLWTPYSKKCFEEIIAGPIGEFSKLISYQNPFENFESFIKGLEVGNGTNSMTDKPKYDLFKLPNK